MPTVLSSSWKACERVASNDLLAELHYPDTQRITIGAPTKPQPVQLDYNRQGEVVAMRDPNTTLHEYSRDLLGRVTLDKATVSTSIAAFEIDSRVNALATTYDDLGRVERVRSYTDHGGGSEAIVNEAVFARDPLWRVISVAQQHDGAVSGGSPAVGTSYETEPIASGNLARQATLVYPDGWTLATGYGASGSVDDRISRPAALVDPAAPETYASYAWIGLSEPAIVDYPIPGVRLTRFEADNGAETPGTYPGLDRFGRVVRQMWVDDGFTENSGSSTVPNVPPIVSIAYTYDTASDRTGAFDARPKSSQPLSNMYAYDGLHRLVDARRGVWTGGLASPSVSQLKGSQEWALDPLGNWSSIGTDLNGAGGIDSDETETRDHRDPSLTPPTNRVNELFQRALAPDTGGGTVDLTYDFAGNLLRQQLQSGGALRYTHDAWNRLVKVELEDAEEDLHPRAEYEYNPLNWRTVERTDTNTADSTHALDEMRAHLYDASWRLLESRIDTDFDPEETSPDFEEHAQLVWGLRYIDDIVSTRRDLNPSEEDGAEVRMFHATDAQFSSVAVLLDNGSLLERVAYSPYGVARHQWPADASGDGAVNSADLSIVLSSYGSITSSTYRSEADFNRDGNVDAADLAAVLSYAAALPEGTLSSPAISNRTGYCGYRFAPETEMYLARNRWLSPPLGRWIQRDPLEYIDGMGLYEYCGGGPIEAVDPTGLDGVDIKFEHWMRARERDREREREREVAQPTVSPSAPFLRCLAQHDTCRERCASRHQLETGGALKRRARLADCYWKCSLRLKNCLSTASGPYNPLSRSSPECDRYSCTDSYFGANARCFCKCAGDDPWSQEVRGCLRRLYDMRVDPDTAHKACYAQATAKGFVRPDATLASCYLQCGIAPHVSPGRPELGMSEPNPWSTCCP